MNEKESENNTENEENTNEEMRQKFLKFNVFNIILICIVIIIAVAFLLNYDKSNNYTYTQNTYNKATSNTLETGDSSIKYNDYSNPLIDEMEATDKPIIYIYPEEEMEVSVKLGNPNLLTTTYPQYTEEGWNVIAEPDGTLTDLKTGRKLYSLYWEGKNSKSYNEELEEGFIVKGEEVAEFLEEKLEILGLNEREAEEFIIYWLPQLEGNEYNYIRFQTMEEIETNMPLEITPKPDCIIRVMMEWKVLDEEIEIEEQELEQVERSGYTVVEWGGTEIGKNVIN